MDEILAEMKLIEAENKDLRNKISESRVIIEGPNNNLVKFNDINNNFIEKNENTNNRIESETKLNKSNNKMNNTTINQNNITNNNGLNNKENNNFTLENKSKKEKQNEKEKDTSNTSILNNTYLTNNNTKLKVENTNVSSNLLVADVQEKEFEITIEEIENMKSLSEDSFNEIIYILMKNFEANKIDSSVIDSAFPSLKEKNTAEFIQNLSKSIMYLLKK